MNFKILSAPANIETVERFANSSDSMEIVIYTTPRHERLMGMINDSTNVDRKHRIKVSPDKGSIDLSSNGYVFVGTIDSGLGSFDGARFIANISVINGETDGTLSTDSTRVIRDRPRL